MALTGQLDFGGREVSGLELSLPGLSGNVKYSVPEGEDPVLWQRDRIRVMMEFGIEDVRFPDKLNTEGVPVDRMKRLAVARTVVPETVQIDAIVRRATLEAIWDADHGVESA